MAHSIFNIVADEETVSDLQACIEDLSDPSVYSRIEYVSLYLTGLLITPTILDLVVQLLNHPLPPGRRGDALYWDIVKVAKCQISRQEEGASTQKKKNDDSPSSSVANDQDVCSQDSIQTFAEALARCPGTLYLHKSPEILECLCHATPYRELPGKRLMICQERFSALECARMGSLVQHSVSLELELVVDDFEEPLALGEGLAKAFQLSLDFRKGDNPNLCDILVREGDCIVRQLLSPNSRLKELRLSDMMLTDHHFQWIVDMLPTSQLEELDVDYNDIGCKGILALARQLPNIQCLKRLALPLTPWDPDRENADTEAMYKECTAAVMQAMFENYSIVESFLGPYWKGQMKYFVDCNRIRQTILAKGPSIPMNVWPMILEQVASWEWRSRWGDEVKFQMYRANALFVAVQKCPLILSRRVLPTKRSRRRVNRRIS